MPEKYYKKGIPLPPHIKFEKRIVEGATKSKGDGGSYHPGMDHLSLSSSADEKTLLHELGHFIQDIAEDQHGPDRFEFHPMTAGGEYLFSPHDTNRLHSVSFYGSIHHEDHDKRKEEFAVTFMIVVLGNEEKVDVEIEKLQRSVVYEHRRQVSYDRFMLQLSSDAGVIDEDMARHKNQDAHKTYQLISDRRGVKPPPKLIAGSHDSFLALKKWYREISIVDPNTSRKVVEHKIKSMSRFVKTLTEGAHGKPNIKMPPRKAAFQSFDG